MAPLRVAVLALLSTSAGATLMPDGRDYPEECIHRLDEEHTVTHQPGLGDVLTNRRTGERRVLPPCPVAATARQQPLESGLGYYSDWVIDVYSVHPSIGRMATTWTVPPAPKSRGPIAGMSSVYLFNGLEDGGGKRGAASVILQPVLSYGKSGCILNPLASWEFTSFQVSGAGRAYCGPHISVNEGDVLTGIMELASGEGQNATWNIISDAGSRGKSVHQATFPEGFQMNAAYLTLEGMIIYGCDALPGMGIDWTANALADPSGRSLTASWQTDIRHTECKPAATVHDATAVSFAWDSTAAASKAELVV